MEKYKNLSNSIEKPISIPINNFFHLAVCLKAPVPIDKNTSIDMVQIRPYPTSAAHTSRIIRFKGNLGLKYRLIRTVFYGGLSAKLPAYPANGHKDRTPRYSPFFPADVISTHLSGGIQYAFFRRENMCSTQQILRLVRSRK